ncbi:SDR family NAD(P)-dependent oxidoreductase [Paenarthrobacter sp. YJN-5]|uniref:SDR family NAD(P)-dependent oxidoreductase n=1 Tax=Paenarthrobacter sp. YJN-5 TaxID=2735316 RepID=UPI0018784683|nr:SDR family oxidoreductase [Paenarthrobacter sp. YJN-5]QOT19825.1 SDR family oxidoreductase [Paenarthrobacter sp. YJN-5]
MTSQPFDLTGRTALVTGGSRGIGAAIVEILARHGATVAFCHHDDDHAAAALTDSLSLEGYSVASRTCDVSIEKEVDDLAEWTSQTVGHVDIVVNSAGVGGGDRPFSAVDPVEWDRVIGVNLRGSYLVTRAFYEPMVEKGWGRVINIASQLAYKGATGLAHYCASKAGVVGFTKALALEGAPHGVLVNTIAPGPVDTALLRGHSELWLENKRSSLPLGRVGEVDEIAPTALLLASDAGSFYVGQTLSPNGGDVLL